ncbi:uncharacterized protein LOC26527597 [Drosophila mojavensis]|uniref:Uncharacterized protein, isoform A n=1 Tax=Drosophila mojavensis TaxID=7230 RepID=A0A0Q9XFZ0_DROMO|nr:uncharacterized protein LOC26527597 [Drosophila mojavensis]KRG07205.1 uncharacterized protein Dmoj_GI26830, isoform A [Drosophila mojavensis]
MAARPVEGGRTRTSEAGNQGVMQQISGDIQRDIQGVQVSSRSGFISINWNFTSETGSGTSHVISNRTGTWVASTSCCIDCSCIHNCNGYGHRHLHQRRRRRRPE